MVDGLQEEQQEGEQELSLFEQATQIVTGFADDAANENRIYTSLLHAPGPTIYDVATNQPGGTIELIIGRVLKLPSVVINSIQLDLPTRYTEEGHPIQAEVNVSFRTHYTYSREDYEQAFYSR